MRKKMTKQVTSTAIRRATIVMEEGKPVAKELPELIVLGNVTEEKAQKMFPQDTILAVETVSKVYEMEVEEFIKLAKVVEPKEN